MKRHITKLVVFLLLGSILNVAVAWGCAVWVDRGQSKITTLRRLPGYTWVVRRGSARGSEFVLSLRSYSDMDVPLPGEGNWPPDLIPSWSTISLKIDPAGPKVGGFQTQLQEARGWPMLSMRCTFLRALSGVGVRTRSEVVGGLEMPPRIWTCDIFSKKEARALPYIPIPLGFVVNTLLYAAFIGLAIAGRSAGRRVIRHRRGHCIKCGYDLRGDPSSGCPECGWRRDDVP